MAAVGALDCEICTEPFDAVARRPKLLNCGHTVCLTCVSGIHRRGDNGAVQCPKDRKETPSSPDDLNDNFYVLSLIEDKKPTKLSTGRFWCLDCKEVADLLCEDKHTICRLRKERGKQMETSTTLLESAVRTQRRLVGALETIASNVQDSLKAQVEETSKALKETSKALTLLYDSLDLVGTDWDRAAAAVDMACKNVQQRIGIDEGSSLLLKPDLRCEVKLRGPHGAFWRADVTLDGDVGDQAVVRALLVAMQRTGVLRDAKEEPETSEKELVQEPEADGAENAVRGRTETQGTDSEHSDEAETEMDWPSQAFASVLNVTTISRTPAAAEHAEKNALLTRTVPVRGLRGLHCGADPAWSLALLNTHSATLEEVQLVHAGVEHLYAVAAMRHLRSLSLHRDSVLPPEWQPQCGAPRPQVLAKLELEVPLGDVLPLLAVLGEVPQLRLVVSDCDPRVHAVARGLRERQVKRIVLTAWCDEPYYRPLKVLVLVRKQDANPRHALRCQSQREALKAELPEVVIVCTWCKTIRT